MRFLGLDVGVQQPTSQARRSLPLRRSKINYRVVTCATTVPDMAEQPTSPGRALAVATTPAPSQATRGRSGEPKARRVRVGSERVICSAGLLDFGRAIALGSVAIC
eukprot:2343422-Rhodomonas_salina.3